MHLAPLIRDLAVILAIAGLVTLLFQRIRQPVVLGYIVAGVIVGPKTPPFPLVTDIPNIHTLAELGVIFLMFGLGLEFSFRKLARVGGTASFTAVFEVVFMVACGLATGRLLGWSSVDSIFLGAMLSVSSTTIIIKALDELGLKRRRFAELVFGILIVEDLVAILLLVALTTLVSSGNLSGLVLAQSFGKLALVVGTWFLAGYFVVPKFIRYVGSFRSDEMLAVLSVGLCLVLVVVAAHFHYSTALGAFIMGSILGESTESHRIEELIKPVRDIFAAIFFVSVGMLIDPAALWEHKAAVIIITVVTIAGKLVSTSLGPLLYGQPVKTSVLVGFSLAQIGEFSFIIATLGLSLNAMSEFLYPIIVSVSLITTFTTPYLIKMAPAFAEKVERFLPDAVREFLAKYTAWRESQATRSARNPERNRRLVRWGVSAFVVTIVNIVIVEYALPMLNRYLAPNFALIAAWALSVFLAAPFLWSMLTVFTGSRGTDGIPERKSGALMAQMFTFVVLGLVSLFYFRAKYVGLIGIPFGAVLFSRLFKQLEMSYRWFEDNFLSTFRAQNKIEAPVDIYGQLAPWDAHLVRVKVDSDSEVSGKRLMDVELRKKFGVNVVAIQRGSKAIVAPKPDQQLFPNDELLMLGTDDQIDAIRAAIEMPTAADGRSVSIEGYELKKLLIEKGSSVLGRSIRNSGLRERHGAMVVGIERRGRRIMNPDSDMVIELGDILSIVGEAGQIEMLFARQSQRSGYE